MVYMTETHIVCTKTEFNFIAAVCRHTQYLSIPSVSSVKCQLVCFPRGNFAYPPKSRLEQWHQWLTPIGWWGPKIAPLPLWSTDVAWPLLGCYGCSRGVLPQIFGCLTPDPTQLHLPSHCKH